MKHTLFIAATLLCVAQYISAQKLYVRAGIGYNLALSESYAQDQVTTATGGAISANFAGVNLAKGAAPVLALGYMLNSHVGLELAGGYILGSDNPYNTTVTLSGNPVVSAKTVTSARLFTLTPSLRLQTTNASGKAGLYPRFSVIVPGTGYAQNDVQRTDVTAAGTRSTVIQTKTTGTPTLGLGGALGGEFNISSKLFVWGEVNAQALRIWSKKTTYEVYDVNGTSALAGLKTYEKEISHVKSLSSSSNNAAYNTGYSTDKPKEDALREANFDAFGIGIGIGYRF